MEGCALGPRLEPDVTFGTEAANAVTREPCETRRMQWPEGFLWGTGASSTQCEGAAPASDWWDWERSGHAPLSGNGNGFASRYAEDFALLAGQGLTHHRLSVEWARLEPEPGVHDAAAVRHYRDVLVAAHHAGVSPWVSLHHFTLPRWFLATGGFLVESNRTEVWRRHVDFVAETFGDLVAGWKPVNETNYYARAAYGGRGWPPGHDDPAEVAMVNEAMHLANAEAALQLAQTGAPVSSIFGLSPIVPQDDDPATASMSQALFDYHWAPWVGLFRDGVLQVPGRNPVERPDLVGFVDMIGFSYYGTMGVREGRLNIHPPDAPLSPLGYGIWADGLGLVLDRIHEELPGTPVLVAEYGIGTDDDASRADYLTRGLVVLHDAIRRGIDVRGLFHWTAVDNYEWLHGYDVSFGIIDCDRRLRASAQVLAREATP
jgi:beta-glucosidase